MDEVQFHVQLDNVYVWFDYQESVLQSENAEIFVCALIDSVANVFEEKRRPSMSAKDKFFPPV